MTDTTPLWALVGRWLDEADAERRTGFVAGSTKAAMLVECADALARVLGGTVRIDPCRDGHRFGSDGVCHDCRRSLGGHVETRHRIGPDGVCIDPECGWSAADEAAEHVARRGLWNQPATPPNPPCARCRHPQEWHSGVGDRCYSGDPQYNEPCDCPAYRPNE